VPTLYRVLPYLPNVPNDEPGGALYVPPQGGGRVDNPDVYAVLYAGSVEAGAIAEAFGRFPEWSEAILQGSPALPGSSRAVARYRLDESVPICNLDDPSQLIGLGLRPSDVVSRDYRKTRDWARRIFQQGVWAGVCWWSYYDPRWSSFGLWALDRLKLEDIRILSLDDAAVTEAARTLSRRILR